MGSPMGPSMANLFMYALEKKFLDDYPPQFKPIIYRRYVDNTFCLFKSEDHVDPLLDHINNCDNSIKLTEANNLPFLDILIQKDANKFSTSLCRNQHLLVCMYS